MRRLFTFGCSFTKFLWSTWADCLAPEFDEFHNWGQSGGGNHFIFNSIMEADQRHRFNNNDTVIVCWTNILREDRYTQGWQTPGNITTCEYYNKDYIVKYITERGCLIRDLALIKGALKFLQSIDNLNFKFLSMCPLIFPDQYKRHNKNHTDVQLLYFDVLDKILPSFYETVLKKDWEQNWETNRRDLHPYPVEHLAYLDTVLPGWVTKQETRAKIAKENLELEREFELKIFRSNKLGLSTVTRL